MVPVIRRLVLIHRPSLRPQQRRNVGSFNANNANRRRRRLVRKLLHLIVGLQRLILHVLEWLLHNRQQLIRNRRHILLIIGRKLIQLLFLRNRQLIQRRRLRRLPSRKRTRYQGRLRRLCLQPRTLVALRGRPANSKQWTPDRKPPALCQSLRRIHRQIRQKPLQLLHEHKR